MKTIIDNKSDYYALLMTYKDYTFLMHLACYNTSSFYFYIKVALNFINILMSSSLSMLNSSELNAVSTFNEFTERNFNFMMIVIKSSVVINLCVCLSSAILYYFQIAERELFFKIHADNYLKLNNIILSEISTVKNIEHSFIKFVLQEFIFLIENMHFAIPTFVKRNLKKNYHNYNIPPYLDVYINNFNIMTKLMNMKNCLQIFKKKNEIIAEQKPVYILSNQSTSPKYFNSISPILKNYCYDSYDKVLSKTAYYSTSNNNDISASI